MSGSGVERSTASRKKRNTTPKTWSEGDSARPWGKERREREEEKLRAGRAVWPCHWLPGCSGRRARRIQGRLMRPAQIIKAATWKASNVPSSSLLTGDGSQEQGPGCCNQLAWAVIVGCLGRQAAVTRRSRRLIMGNSHHDNSILPALAANLTRPLSLPIGGSGIGQVLLLPLESVQAHTRGHADKAEGTAGQGPGRNHACAAAVLWDLESGGEGA